MPAIARFHFLHLALIGVVAGGCASHSAKLEDLVSGEKFAVVNLENPALDPSLNAAEE